MHQHHSTFRLGTTSYIIPAGLAENARWLAQQRLPGAESIPVRDMQLVLFDLPAGPSNLPNAATLAALQAVAAEYDFTYTVHLISDLRLGDAGEEDYPALLQARQVIELTRVLNPWAYVLHLDGRHVKTLSAQHPIYRRWQQDCAGALALLGEWTGDATLLAVENLEGYSPNFVQPVVERTAASRCVDIGHLWLDGHDPLPYLAATLPRTRVIHLHGLHEGRDHQSLMHTPPAQLDPIIALLLQAQYNGVLTLEVFGEEDFHSSLSALRASMERCLLRLNNP